MEVYIDDMLVKSRTSKTHTEDLEKTFATLKKYQMKLNPTKCAFRVTSDKFLDFMVSNWRIEANPKKIQAIQEMGSSKNIKEAQHLIGKMAALN